MYLLLRMTNIFKDLIANSLIFDLTKLKKYKSQGIDQLSKKTEDLGEIIEILDKMANLAKENNSLSGSSDNFESKSRIIEKIK